jgi:branched-chain amino acid aminotransferase
MQTTGYIDGFIGPIDQIRVPVLDRGFLYGDSVYEVFRTYEGIPFLFDEHYERLLHSAELSGMHISQSLEELVDAIKRTIDASGNASREDVYVRYQITRGEGQVDLAPPADLESRLIIIVKSVPQWDPVFYSSGMTMSVPRQRRNAVNSLDPNIKGGNYLNNILALAESRAAGKNECLMLDARGMVTECSNSNAWFVIDGQFVTPAAGNLVGLTRRSLVDLLNEAGEPFAERDMHSDELVNASECFVTSATREVMPVRALTLEDGRELSFPEGGGEMTRKAMALYSDMLKRFIGENRERAWF